MRGDITPSAIPEITYLEIAGCLDALCDTGVCLMLLQGLDDSWYSLRMIPGEYPGYRVFSHNNGAILPFSSTIANRSEAVRLFLEILNS